MSEEQFVEVALDADPRPAELGAILQTIACNVLENAAFILCERAESDPAWSDDALVAELRFSSEDHQGCLVLRATREFCTLLAANLLGLDAEQAEAAERAEGALSEMTNMMAGELTATLFRPEAEVQIGIPVTRTVGQEDDLLVAGEEAACRISLLTFEEQRLEVAARVWALEVRQ